MKPTKVRRFWSLQSKSLSSSIWFASRMLWLCAKKVVTRPSGGVSKNMRFAVRHEQWHSSHQVDLSRQRTGYLRDSQQDLWMAINHPIYIKWWYLSLKFWTLSLFLALSLFLRNFPPNIHPPKKVTTNCTGIATFFFFPFRSIPKLLWCHWSARAPHFIKPGDMLYLSTNCVSLCQTRYLKQSMFSVSMFFVSCISSPNVINKEKVGKIGFSNKKRSSFELKAQKTKLTCLLYMSTQPDLLGSSYWIQLSLWFPQQQRMLPLWMMKGLSSATRCFWPGMNVLELIIPCYSCYVPKPLRLMQILQMQSVGRITLAKATIVLPRLKLSKRWTEISDKVLHT